MNWFGLRVRRQVASQLADGELVLTHTRCAPLGNDLGPADDVEREAVLTDRSLYYVLAADGQVVALPFARMHQLNRRGMAMLHFRIEDSDVTWELKSPSFAARAERQFRAHGMAAHREWVTGREPAGFQFRAHHDLLSRLISGISFSRAVEQQHTYVGELVYADTQDLAHARAAARRLTAVHTLLWHELQQLQEAMPKASTVQRAQALVGRPAPWPEDGISPDDGVLADDRAITTDPARSGPWAGDQAGTPADRPGVPVP